MELTAILAIASPLMGTIAALAGVLYKNERDENKSLKREVKYLTAIIVSQGAKKDDMLAEYKRFLEAKDIVGGE